MQHSEWQTIYQEMAEVIGEEATLLIFKNFRGSTVNFPLRLVRHEITVRQVQLDHQRGLSVHQLSQKYDLAERTVRHYVQLNSK